MEITLHPASAADKPILANLMQLYLHDFSEIDGADVDEQGCYSFPSFDRYWSEERYYPFLIRADGRIAGFALVNHHSCLHDSFDGHAIAEFFVLRKYRRQGVGRAAAIQIFERFPGRWEVAELAANTPAQAFWRGVIDRYTGGRYEEIWVQSPAIRGPVQSFVVQLPPPDTVPSEAS